MVENATIFLKFLEKKSTRHGLITTWYIFSRFWGCSLPGQHWWVCPEPLSEWSRLSWPHQFLYMWMSARFHRLVAAGSSVHYWYLVVRPFNRSAVLSLNTVVICFLKYSQERHGVCSVSSESDLCSFLFIVAHKTYHISSQNCKLHSEYQNLC